MIEGVPVTTTTFYSLTSVFCLFSYVAYFFTQRLDLLSPKFITHVYGEVTNLATSRCNGIWETTGNNRYNGLLPTPTCYGLALGKLV